MGWQLVGVAAVVVAGIDVVTLVDVIAGAGVAVAGVVVVVRADAGDLWRWTRRGRRVVDVAAEVEVVAGPDA